jgi:hypothetical protein
MYIMSLGVIRQPDLKLSANRTMGFIRSAAMAPNRMVAVRFYISVAAKFCFGVCRKNANDVACM